LWFNRQSTNNANQLDTIIQLILKKLKRTSQKYLFRGHCPLNTAVKFKTMTDITPDLGYLFEYDKVQAAIQDKYRNWVQVIRDIEKVSREVQHRLHIPKDNMRPMLAALLFSRTISNVAASTLIFESGFESQGRALLRVAMESTFILVAIDKNPELADQFAQEDDLQRKRMFHKARMWNSPELQEQARAHSTDEKLAEIQEAIKENAVKKMTTEEYSKAAGLHDWYLTAYSLFSTSIHNSVRDLESHIDTDHDGEIIQIINEPILDGLESLYITGSEILLSALNSVSNIFELDVSQFVTQTQEKLTALADEIEG
jgi:hypothetical protein